MSRSYLQEPCTLNLEQSQSRSLYYNRYYLCRSTKCIKMWVLKKGNISYSRTKYLKGKESDDVAYVTKNTKKAKQLTVGTLMMSHNPQRFLWRMNPSFHIECLLIWKKVLPVSRWAQAEMPIRCVLVLRDSVGAETEAQVRTIDCRWTLSALFYVDSDERTWPVSLRIEVTTCSHLFEIKRSEKGDQLPSQRPAMNY